MRGRMRKMRKGWSLAAVATGVGLSACLFSPPPKETVLRLVLNDSLAFPKFDSVEIVLLSPDSSRRVLDTVFSGPLYNPKVDYSLDTLGLRDGQFVVRVRAFKYDGQLGVELYISKPIDTLVVQRVTLPPPTPYLVCLPGLDIMSQNHHGPSFDSGGVIPFEIVIPRNLDTVVMSMANFGSTFDPRGEIYLDSDLIYADSVTIYASGLIDSLRGNLIFKPLDTLVADTNMILALRNHGHKRDYTVHLIRDTLGIPRLHAFSTTPGGWVPAFNPTTAVYVDTVPLSTLQMTVDTLRVDAGTIVTFNDVVLPQDSLPAPLDLQGGGAYITILLFNGTWFSIYYQFTVTRQ